MRTTATEPREIKVKTVERTLMLLEIMAEQNCLLSLTRLAKLAKLSASTTFRLLNTLTRSGFIERDKATGHYKLGLKAFLIGNAALQNVSLRPTAMPFLELLARQCDEAVYLAVLSNQDVFYSDCVKTSAPFQIGIQINTPFPACQTSSGKVLLAGLTPDEIEYYTTYYFKNKLIHDKQSFLKELEQTGTQGFSTSISSLGAGIRELSVPIYNHTRTCVAAISIFRYSQNDVLTASETELLDRLKETGLQISKAIGFSTAPVRYNGGQSNEQRR